MHIFFVWVGILYVYIIAIDVTLWTRICYKDKGNGKVVPVILTKHDAMKVY